MKLMALSTLQHKLAAHRKSGNRIVFTNGCFDILHAGHVRYLSAAKAQGHILVVGLNSDRSVCAIKGKGRPIVPQHHRAEVLAGLSCVDYLVFFDEETPLSLIQALRPDVLVKGADWAEDQIVGSESVKANGGCVVRIPIDIDMSTSRIISKILEQYGPTSSSERR